MFSIIIQHKPVFRVYFFYNIRFFLREPSQKKVNEKV